jgi:hypothetical protein
MLKRNQLFEPSPTQPPKGNVSIPLSKRFDPYWTVQQTDRFPSYSIHVAYMLHTCCILRQTVQPLGVWQFRAIQLPGLVGGPQVDVG